MRTHVRRIGGIVADERIEGLDTEADSEDSSDDTSSSSSEDSSSDSS